MQTNTEGIWTIWELGIVAQYLKYNKISKDVFSFFELMNYGFKNAYADAIVYSSIKFQFQNNIANVLYFATFVNWNHFQI